MAQPRLCFILHGKRSPGHLSNRIIERFGRDFQLDIHITTSAVSAEEVAFLAVGQGCEFLIAAGGDGTVHEVVNGMMRADEAARRQVVLGVLPFGTGNDYARSLQVGASLGELERMIRARSWMPVDLVAARLADGRVRYADNVASMGIASAIVERVGRMPRWLPASLSYGLGTLSALLDFKPQRMRVRLDDGTVVCDEAMLCVAVAKGRYFGGGLGIAPAARLDDGRLQLVLIRDASWPAFLRFMPVMRRAEPVQDARVRYLDCDALTVESRACPLETDGEPTDGGTVRFSVVPDALRCLTPLAQPASAG